MSRVNLYDVLDLEPDCTKSQIKDAYRRLAKEYHPDKPKGDEGMYQLITHAYTVLKDPVKRREYDNVSKLAEQSSKDHFNRRKQAEDYYKAQEDDKDIEKKKDNAKKDFAKAMSEFDRKHKIDRTKEDKISKGDFKRRMEDLQLARQNDDDEMIHERIFDDGEPFDNAKFNAAFDAMHRGTMDLIPHSGNPNAYNMADGFGSAFTSLDNYDGLYDENDDLDIGGANFGSVNHIHNRKTKLTKEEIKKLDGSQYRDFDKIDQDYSKLFEERVKERERFLADLDKRELDDFDTDPEMGGYGIHYQVGIRDPKALEWKDFDEDTTSAYNRLLEDRKKDLTKK